MRFVAVSDAVLCSRQIRQLATRCSEPAQHQGYQITSCKDHQPPQNGQKVQLWGAMQPNPNAKLNHLWRFKRVDNGWYEILTPEEKSTFRLDAHRSDYAKDGCQVQVWSFPPHGTVGDNAQWTPEYMGDNTWRLRNRCPHRPMFLNSHLPDCNKDGCKVQLWGATGGDNERWRLIKVA
jgi:hypothetical protein